MVLISASRSSFTVAQFDRLVIKKFFQILNYGPIRNVVYHAVTGFMYASLAEILLPSALWLMGQSVRMRLKLHRDASDQAMRDTFASFGIMELPRCIGGLFQVNGSAWLTERARIEGTRNLEQDS